MGSGKSFVVLLLGSVELVFDVGVGVFCCWRRCFFCLLLLF